VFSNFVITYNFFHGIILVGKISIFTSFMFISCVIHRNLQFEKRHKTSELVETEGLHIICESFDV